MQTCSCCACTRRPARGAARAARPTGSARAAALARPCDARRPARAAVQAALHVTYTFASSCERCAWVRAWVTRRACQVDQTKARTCVCRSRARAAEPAKQTSCTHARPEARPRRPRRGRVRCGAASAPAPRGAPSAAAGALGGRPARQTTGNPARPAAPPTAAGSDRPARGAAGARLLVGNQPLLLQQADVGAPEHAPGLHLRLRHVHVEPARARRRPGQRQGAPALGAAAAARAAAACAKRSA